MARKISRFKRGAASFYIVAFSTLILVVIATSFSMVIISEISRSSNDDLSQSAYDSALAGVEDAKVAYSNYRRCVEARNKNSSIVATEPLDGEIIASCQGILWVMERMPEDFKCYTVGYILGKIPYKNKMEVPVGATITTSGTSESVLNQAYTCVEINTNLKDYRATLGPNKATQVIRAQVGSGSRNAVSKLKLSWYSVRSDASLKFANFLNNKVIFPRIGNSTVATPPTVELQIVQTADSFRMDDFDKVEGNKTNRATLYLVPAEESFSTSVSSNYVSGNTISEGDVAWTNNHSVSIKPFAVYCNPNNEFYCTTVINLPNVIGGSNHERNNDTFILALSLPYQRPETDFSIEMYCNDMRECGGTSASLIGGADDQATISNTQISIDSTGRANDLYRRVETRMETSDTTYGFSAPHYALQILGNDAVTKNMAVAVESDEFRF